MMRRLLLAIGILVAIAASPAAAQVCPTAAPGTSNSQCASTAFVKAAVVGTPIPWANITGTPTTLAGYGITNARTQLTAGQNYWVNGNSGSSAACGPTGASTCAAGSDSNNCLTPATACLTTQHVINLILDTVDIAGFNATIFLAHNTGTQNYAFTCEAGPVLGQSIISVQGDGNAPTAVVIQATTSAVAVKDGCTIGLANLAFKDNGSNNASAFISVGIGQYGHVDINVASFGALGIGTAIAVSYGGSVTLIGANAVTGSENAFVSVSSGGVIDIVGTVAGSASITWGTAAAVVQSGGVISDVNGSTFTGFSGVSGPRCFFSTQVTSPDGVNPNSVFPGSSDCVIDTVAGAIGLQTGSGGSSSIGYGTAGQALLSGGSSSAKDTWGSLRQILTGATGGTIAAGTTSAFLYQSVGASSGAGVSGIFPLSGTIKNFYAGVTTAPGAGQTFTMTVLVGTLGSPSASALTCTMSNTTTCNDTTHSVTVTAGQAYSFQIVASGSATSTAGVTAAIEFDNP